MKSILIDFKTAKEPWFEELQALYVKKINPFWTFEVQSLKTLKQERQDKEAKKKFEETELLKKLTSDDYIILFDEKGKDLDSLQFSVALEKSTLSGKKRVVFLIGGAYGVSDHIFQKAHLKVSLSKMVLNHLVAEAVVLEQIYRGLTILNRIPYHNI